MRTVRLACLVATVAVFAATPAVAKENDSFTTIAAAIEAAEPGEVVYVPAGTYAEQVVLKEGMMLVGESADTTIIDGDGLKRTVIPARNSAIVGFTIQNGSGVGIFNEGHFIGVFDCKLINNVGNAIRMNHGSGVILNNVIAGAVGQSGLSCLGANPLVVNNTFVNNVTGLLALHNQSVTVTNNLFACNKTAIKVDNNASTVLEGNVFYGNRYNISGQELSETDNVSSAPPPDTAPASIEVPRGDIDAYRGMMETVLSIVIAERSVVVYDLPHDELGRFGLSVFSPRATFAIAASATNTVIEEYGASDLETGDLLSAKYVEQNGRPVVKVENSDIVEQSVDRYVLDELCYHPQSYFENDVGQLVFKRLTNVSRIHILVPQGHVPVSINHPASIESEDGRSVVKIANIGDTDIELLMEQSP